MGGPRLCGLVVRVKVFVLYPKTVRSHSRVYTERMQSDWRVGKWKVGWIPPFQPHSTCGIHPRQWDPRLIGSPRLKHTTVSSGTTCAGPGGCCSHCSLVVPGRESEFQASETFCGL